MNNILLGNSASEVCQTISEYYSRLDGNFSGPVTACYGANDGFLIQSANKETGLYVANTYIGYGTNNLLFNYSNTDVCLILGNNKSFYIGGNGSCFQLDNLGTVSFGSGIDTNYCGIQSYSTRPTLALFEKSSNLNPSIKFFNNAKQNTFLLCQNLNSGVLICNSKELTICGGGGAVLNLTGACIAFTGKSIFNDCGLFNCEVNFTGNTNFNGVNSFNTPSSQTGLSINTKSMFCCCVIFSDIISGKTGYFTCIEGANNSKTGAFNELYISGCSSFTGVAKFNDANFKNINSSGNTCLTSGYLCYTGTNFNLCGTGASNIILGSNITICTTGNSSKNLNLCSCVNVCYLNSDNTILGNGICSSGEINKFSGCFYSDKSVCSKTGLFTSYLSGKCVDSEQIYSTGFICAGGEIKAQSNICSNLDIKAGGCITAYDLISGKNIYSTCDISGNCNLYISGNACVGCKLLVNSCISGNGDLCIGNIYFTGERVSGKCIKIQTGCFDYICTNIFKTSSLEADSVTYQGLDADNITKAWGYFEYSGADAVTPFRNITGYNISSVDVCRYSSASAGNPTYDAFYKIKFNNGIKFPFAMNVNFNALHTPYAYLQTNGPTGVVLTTPTVCEKVCIYSTPVHSTLMRSGTKVGQTNPELLTVGNCYCEICFIALALPATTIASQYSSSLTYAQGKCRYFSAMFNIKSFS
jgi:hypothetical protein